MSTPASCSSPTTEGPIKPAKFALMLMKPIETAAAEDDRVKVGSTQNGEGHDTAKNPTRHNHVMTAAADWPGIAAAPRQTPSDTWPATQCHLRSPVRSEDWPDSQTPPRPHA